MAVRFSASGQTFSSTSSPPDDPFSITCWAYMVNDRNAISGIWGAAGTTSMVLATTSDGTTLQAKGSGGTIGNFAMTPGVWYKFGVTNNGTDYFYHAPAGSALTVDSGSMGNIVSASTLRIGCSSSTSEWFDGRIAAVKVWNVALSGAQIEQELAQYVPYRTSGLTRWHPFLSTSTVDFSGNGRTLSGGSGSSTEAGPPIPWRPPQSLHVPWDPATTVWYAVFATTTGELLSTGSVDPRPLPGGQGLKEYITGQPDLSIYEWDVVARDFVLRAGVELVDRVADLVADPVLSSVWATLDSTQDTALQDRVGQMLGPYRYRYPYQDVDLT